MRLSSHSLLQRDMTKLTEWIVFAGLAFSIWITLLTDILPLKVSYKAKEVIWPVRSEKTVHHGKNILRLSEIKLIKSYLKLFNF